MIAKRLGYKRYFNVPQFVFKLNGIDVTVKEHSVKKPLLTWIPTGSLVLLLFFMARYSWDNRYEMDKVTDALAPFVQSMLSVWKIVVYVVTERNMLQLMRRIWTMSRNDNGEEHAIIAELNEKETKFSKAYFLAVTCTGLSLFVIPTFSTMAIYFRTGKVELFMPLRGSFPFDYTLPWNYALLFIWSMCAMYCVSNVSVSLDSLYLWMVSNIVAQFRVLNLRLQKASAEKNSFKQEKMILNCIRYHQEVISVATEFDLVFRPIIFLQFTVSCLQICFIAYQLGTGTAKADAFFLVMFMASVSFQMILYCYGGQMVQNESLSVSENVFISFQWENLPTKLKKFLLMIMLRAQKRCNMTGIFFIVDLSLFLWVFKTAGSFVTMLWTLDGNQSN